MLHIKNLHTRYGPVKVLKNVSIHVDRGEIVSLIGANGAGKTTLLHTISGLLKPVEGSIVFGGSNIAGLAPDRIVRLGISQSPESRQIFSPLSVLENLQLGAYQRYRKKSERAGIERDIEEVFQLFPRLRERASQVAGTLSGGEQQILPIGRALMARPSLLLLDEPSLGLAPQLVELIMDTITEMNGKGMTILLVEQNAKKALEVSHRGYVLETGAIALAGDAKELANNPQVKEVYLGGA
jgi:branched-chain amino acid transport system ATP-binding protein